MIITYEKYKSALKKLKERKSLFNNATDQVNDYINMLDIISAYRKSTKLKIDSLETRLSKLKRGRILSVLKTTRSGFNNKILVRFSSSLFDESEYFKSRIVDEGKFEKSSAGVYYFKSKKYCEILFPRNFNTSRLKIISGIPTILLDDNRAMWFKQGIGYKLSLKKGFLFEGHHVE